MTKHVFRWGYAFLWPVVMFVAFESVVRGSGGVFLLWARNTQFETLLINILLLFALFNLFQFIRKTGLFVLSQIVMTALVMVMAVVSFYKIQLRMEPILPSDIHLIGSALDIAKGYIPHFTAIVIGAAALLIIIFFAVLFCLRKQKRRGRGMYIPFALAALIAACGAWYVFQGETGALGSYVNQAYSINYSLVRNAHYNGTAFQLMKQMQDDRLEAAPPAAYSRAAIESILAQLDEADENAAFRPNIIIVLGESMADIAALDEIALKSDPMPRIHELMERLPSSVITVDTFGGGTYMTETQILAGMAVTPYVTHRVDTVAWRLKPLGYKSTVVHSYWGWFFDRQKNLKEMGFDLFMPVETFTTTPTFAPYPEDAALYRQVLEVMDKTKEQDLIFAATMQTHGGYDYDPLYETPLNETPLNEKAERELNNFLFLQKGADAALGDFMDAIAKRAEPTVVIYFGDHYPSIPLTLEALGLQMDDKGLYEMPYFVYANFDFAFEAVPTTPARLMAQILETLHMPMTTSQSLQLMGDRAALDLIAYDALSGEQYAAKMLSQTYQNDGYQIGLVPRVDKIQILGDDLFALEGEHIPWRMVMKLGNTKSTVIAQTDGKTAVAPLPEQLRLALQAREDGVICFVNDAEKPFYELPMPLYP